MKNLIKYRVGIYLIRCLFLFFVFHSSEGNCQKNGIIKSAGILSSISTDAVSPVTLCAGQTLSLTFNIDANANTGNNFTAQLSNASGSFASPVTIGTLNSVSLGTISATIPSATVQGYGYRIRIVSSAPVVTGTDNGTNLTVLNTVGNAGTIIGTATVCQGQTAVTYSVSAITNATGYNWTLPSGASINSGANTNSITVNYNSSAVPGVIAVNGFNSCSSGAASSFTVYVSPVTVSPVISAGGSTGICSGGTVTLSVNSPLATNTYQWRKNGATISGATSTSYSATAVGSYDVVTSFIPITKQTLTNSTSYPIPDNSCVGAASSIVVSGYNAPVQTSKIYIKFSITHTFIGDLVLVLEAPNGQHLGITNQTGNVNNSGQNYTNTVIADSGSIIIPTSGAPYTGLYKPNYTLFTNCASSTVSSFGAIGGGAINPNGTWKLLAYDRFAGDVGTITSFAITFPNSPASSCPSNSNAIAVTLNAATTFSNFSPSSGLAGSTVTINGSGLTSVTGVKFNGVSATNFTIVNATQITAVVPSGATTGIITLVACSNVNSATNFTVIPTLVTLNLKVFLQGFYNGNGTMVPIVSSTLTDTITVELHLANSPYTTIYSATGVLSIYGLVALTYPATATGNSYYIVVRHRNSIETWSKLPAAITTNTSYDFSH